MVLMNKLAGLWRPTRNTGLRVVTSSYSREFLRALEDYTVAARDYLEKRSTTPPVPFSTLAVNVKEGNPEQLLEGLFPVGKIPWYFIGSPEMIDGIEVKLKEKADVQGAKIILAKSGLRCERREGDKYVPCSLDEYIRAGAPMSSQYRLQATPPAAAYVDYPSILQAA